MSKINFVFLHDVFLFYYVKPAPNTTKTRSYLAKIKKSKP